MDATVESFRLRPLRYNAQQAQWEALEPDQVVREREVDDRDEHATLLLIAGSRGSECGAQDCAEDGHV